MAHNFLQTLILTNSLVTCQVIISQGRIIIQRHCQFTLVLFFGDIAIGGGGGGGGYQELIKWRSWQATPEKVVKGPLEAQRCLTKSIAMITCLF